MSTMSTRQWLAAIVAQVVALALAVGATVAPTALSTDVDFAPDFSEQPFDCSALGRHPDLDSLDECGVCFDGLSGDADPMSKCSTTSGFAMLFNCVYGPECMSSGQPDNYNNVVLGDVHYLHENLTAKVISMPFSFPFLGRSHDNVIASVSGAIFFNSSSTDAEAVDVLAVLRQRNHLYQGEGFVKTWIEIEGGESGLMVHWYNYTNIDADDESCTQQDFRAELWESGRISLVYKRVCTSAATVVGIERADGYSHRVPQDLVPVSYPSDTSTTDVPFSFEYTPMDDNCDDVTQDCAGMLRLGCGPPLPCQAGFDVCTEHNKCGICQPETVEQQGTCVPVCSHSDVPSDCGALNRDPCNAILGVPSCGSCAAGYIPSSNESLTHGVEECTKHCTSSPDCELWNRLPCSATTEADSCGPCEDEHVADPSDNSGSRCIHQCTNATSSECTALHRMPCGQDTRFSCGACQTGFYDSGGDPELPGMTQCTSFCAAVDDAVCIDRNRVPCSQNSLFLRSVAVGECGTCTYGRVADTVLLDDATSCDNAGSWSYSHAEKPLPMEEWTTVANFADAVVLNTSDSLVHFHEDMNDGRGFPFFGVYRRAVHVTPSALLTFADRPSNPIPIHDFPSVDVGPHSLVAVAWGSFEFSSNSDFVMARTTATEATVEFRAQLFSTQETLHAQVVLRASGAIEFLYLDVPATGVNSLKAGVEDDVGVEGFDLGTPLSSHLRVVLTPEVVPEDGGMCVNVLDEDGESVECNCNLAAAISGACGNYSDFVTTCDSLDTSSIVDIPRACPLYGVYDAVWGDGFCHEELFNEECGWDGGDCCVDQCGCISRTALRTSDATSVGTSFPTVPGTANATQAPSDTVARTAASSAGTTETVTAAPSTTADATETATSVPTTAPSTTADATETASARPTAVPTVDTELPVSTSTPTAQFSQPRTDAATHVPTAFPTTGAAIFPTDDCPCPEYHCSRGSTLKCDLLDDGCCDVPSCVCEGGISTGVTVVVALLALFVILGAVCVWRRRQSRRNMHFFDDDEDGGHYLGTEMGVMDDPSSYNYHWSAGGSVR